MVCCLSRTYENLPVRPDLTERLAGKVAFYGEYDKSPKHTEQKSQGKGKHGPADAGKYFGVGAHVDSVLERCAERGTLSYFPP